MLYALSWAQSDSKYTSFMCHVVALALPGVSKNHFFNYIVSNIVNASAVGLKNVDLFGLDIRIIIDMIGFVTDYTAVSSVLVDFTYLFPVS